LPDAFLHQQIDANNRVTTSTKSPLLLSDLKLISTMRRWSATLSLLLGPMVIGVHRADAAPDPLGRWLTANQKAVVEIQHCGAMLCGKIVGLAKNVLPNGSVPRDERNPDTRLQGRPVCGLEVLRLEWSTEDHVWRGHLYDPGKGRTYRGAITFIGEATLRLRGYLLIIPWLSQEQQLTAYAGNIGENCQISQGGNTMRLLTP